VPRLIVNADDFGLTSGVNRAILEAHRRGIVTSATLMACGARFAEAVQLAAQAPTLSVGCHVLLIDARPLLAGQEIPSLVLKNTGGEAQFRNSMLHFAGRALARHLDADEIEAEIIAQIRKLQQAGIQVSHLDSHKHTHLFPAVFRPMLRAAQKCGVRAVRNAFEPLFVAGTRQWKRRFQLRILSAYQKSFRQALAESGLVSPDACIGVAATGGLDFHRFRALVENLPDGTWELVTHPGYNDRELDAVNTRLRASRETELALLTSGAVKELLERERIELISYAEFGERAPATPKYHHL
jgi:hopanoid biosynthesis associated protein HpnK